MYSSMMTPVCTDTPNRARNPTPLETLKCVPVKSSASKPPNRRHRDVCQDQQRPLGSLKHGVKNNENQEKRDGQDKHQALRRSFLAFILAGPIEVVTGRQFHLLLDLSHRFFHRAAEIAAANAVFDGNVARIFLTIDFRRAVDRLYAAQLRQ